jgi:hypothetical protein
MPLYMLVRSLEQPGHSEKPAQIGQIVDSGNGAKTGVDPGIDHAGKFGGMVKLGADTVVMADTVETAHIEVPLHAAMLVLGVKPAQVRRLDVDGELVVCSLVGVEYQTTGSARQSK